MENAENEKQATSIKKVKGSRKGIKNKPKETLVVLPLACPKCNSHEIIVRGNPPRKPAEGNFVHQGERYTRIEWKRSECKDCGQVIIQRRFMNKVCSEAQKARDENL